MDSSGAGPPAKSTCCQTGSNVGKRKSKSFALSVSVSLEQYSYFGKDFISLQSNQKLSP